MTDAEKAKFLIALLKTEVSFPSTIWSVEEINLLKSYLMILVEAALEIPKKEENV